MNEIVSALLEAVFSLPVLSSRSVEIDRFLREIEETDLSSPIKPEHRALYLLKKGDLSCGRKDFAAFEEYSRRALAAAAILKDEALKGTASAFLLRAVLRTGQLEEAGELAAGVERKIRDGLSTDLFSIVSRMALAEFNLENKNVSPAVLYFKSAESFAEGKERFGHERYNANLSLALCHEMRGDFEKALDALERCRSIASQESAVEEEIEVIFPIANLLTGQKRYAESVNLLERGVKLCEETNREIQKAVFLTQTALNRMSVAEYEDARRDALAAQWIYTKNNDIMGYIQTVGLISASHAAEKNFEEAYRILSYSAAVMKKHGKKEAEEILRRMVGDLRKNIGEDKFDWMAKAMYEREKERLGSKN